MRIIFIAALALLAGCGHSDRWPTYRANGAVHFADGRPLAGGTILCESPHGLAARAIINEDGTFQLGTYDAADGAVEGKHRAIVQPMSSADSNPDQRAERRPMLDARFMSFDTSGIELDVTPRGPNHFEVVVTRPK